MTKPRKPKPITPEQLAASESESGHQKALFAWSAMHDVVTQYPDLRWMYSIPNGGLRDKITAGRMRAEGLKKGVPDIHVPVKRGSWLGLFVEMKRPKQSDGARAGMVNKTTQSPWINYLREQGYGVAVCIGWEQARQVIIQYLEYKD